MARLTQTERVLLQARSYNGVCQADFAHPVCDGGVPITRVGARLYDLDAAGYSFEVIGWRCKTKVFRLVSGPSGSVESDRGGNPSRQSVGASTVAVNAPDRLFEPEAPRPASHWQVG